MTPHIPINLIVLLCDKTLTFVGMFSIISFALLIEKRTGEPVKCWHMMYIHEVYGVVTLSHNLVR